MTQRFMIVERFRDGTGDAVYARLAERGRMMPAGLTYLDSWIRADRALCFQLMETSDRALLDEWMAHWDDLMEFEVVPVITSAEAQVLGS